MFDISVIEYRSSPSHNVWISVRSHIVRANACIVCMQSSLIQYAIIIKYQTATVSHMPSRVGQEFSWFLGSFNRVRQRCWSAMIVICPHLTDKCVTKPSLYSYTKSKKIFIFSTSNRDWTSIPVPLLSPPPNR